MSWKYYKYEITHLSPPVLIVPSGLPEESVPSEVPESPGMPVGRGPTVDERVIVLEPSTETKTVVWVLIGQTLEVNVPRRSRASPRGYARRRAVGDESGALG